MSTTLNFASGTLRCASNSVSATADNSYTTFTNAVTILTGGASGTKIEEITLQGIGTTVAGNIHIIIYDGTTNHLFDSILVPAQTASATATIYRSRKQYETLWLPSASFVLKASSMVASQLIKVHALGSDY